LSSGAPAQTETSSHRSNRTVQAYRLDQAPDPADRAVLTLEGTPRSTAQGSGGRRGPPGTHLELPLGARMLGSQSPIGVTLS
jgi:hypothetical protein